MEGSEGAAVADFNYASSPWILTIVLSVTSIVLLYINNEWRIHRCRSLGIGGPRPLPVIGNLHNILKKGFMAAEKEWLKEYGEVFSFWFGRKQMVFVQDKEMLKLILVKDFQKFTNRSTVDTVPGPLDKGIFFQKDSDWKRTRTILSPTFSASKLKQMKYEINRCAKTLAQSLSKHEGVSIIIKHFIGCFTMDVISSTAFGLKTDSLNNPEEPFIHYVSNIFNPKTQRLPLYLVLAVIFGGWMEKILKFFHICFAPKSCMDFFVKEVKGMIKHRQENPSEAHDFLQLMINAEMDSEECSEKDKSKKLTTDEIIGQAFLFFLAGYETTATTLSYASYHLALNQNIQDRLYEEIQEHLPDEEEPSYDNIGKLKYLEQVILETLRMYPALSSLNRVAATDVTVKGITIPKGAGIRIPVYRIQHDPDIYEDPEEFLPERFADRKVNDKQIDFLPFGYGPRICIGSRLAMMEAKMALVHVLRKIRFTPGPDTEIPLRVKDVGFVFPVNPIKIKIELR